MNIKVCGITKMEQLIQLDKMEIDYAGLVFDGKSGTDMRSIINPKELTALSLDIQIVGRFKNCSIDTILQSIDDYRFNIVQIDNPLSVSECGLLTEQVELIKTIHLKEGGMDDALRLLELYDEVSDYYCFDMMQGHSFPWNMPNELPIEKPFFIGGSWLIPADANILHRYHHPDFYGIDIGKSFEKAPGDMDTALILSFVRSVNQVDN